jgi:uncharacterized protein (DUF2235 family)
MARNIVICCDGTNNSLQGTPTNIAQLSRLADIGDPGVQSLFYDAGVGVENLPGMRTRIGGRFSQWFGSAFGTGLVENVEQAYRHLVRNYVTGDQVFLFGFSRGAYTVRVIAGLLGNYGLLKKENESLIHSVIKQYRALFPDDDHRDAAEDTKEAHDARFAAAREVRQQHAVDLPIQFMGLFDTVSSLGWAWDPKSFPNTSYMPNVRCVRHALAIDERRAKFRTNRVKAAPGCELTQLWFAGVHSDVGGGYKPPNNRLSRIPLHWMLAEARKAGMRVNDIAERLLNLDATRLSDEQQPQNESLDSLWNALEFMPLPHWDKTEDGWVKSWRTYRREGWRRIDGDIVAHGSLRRRGTPVKNIYWPQSLPSMTFVE